MKIIMDENHKLVEPCLGCKGCCADEFREFHCSITKCLYPDEYKIAKWIEENKNDINRLTDFIMESWFYRWNSCGKAIKKDGTFIMIHKQGEQIPFCEECGDKALDCMKWYLEFVEPNPLKGENV